MPNLNYAEVWNPELLEIRIQETLSSPFITQNVNPYCKKMLPRGGI